MTTPRDLIKGALEILGVIDPVEEVDGDEITGLFARLNRMMAAWSTRGSLIYIDTLVSHVLTGGDGDYTIGTGADIDTPLPTAIKAAYVRDGDLDYKLHIIDEVDYSTIADKTVQTAYPAYLFLRGGYPTATVQLRPIPDGAYTLFMEVTQPLSSFSGLSQTISLPPGYEEAIEYNFALRVAPLYSKMASQEIRDIAADSLAGIVRANRANSPRESVATIPGFNDAQTWRGFP